MAQPASSVPADVEVSVLMPCLDEAKTVGQCVQLALETLRAMGVDGEVIVADNGSTDGSQRIAEQAGARVVGVPQRGYGAALMGGIRAARGTYVVMADADGSYDFGAIAPFIQRLRDGNDLVMGNRFAGGIAPGAMPWHHRWLGNPVLTRIGRLLFRAPSRDFHCGMRAFRRDAILDLGLRTTGMEFASEMVVKAALNGLRMAEVPTTLRPAGRGRPPHLRSWPDGWRHLRFLMIYSPRWLFLYPGMALMVLGTAVGIWLMPGPRTVGGTIFNVQTLLYAALAVVVGFQSVLFSVFSKVFAVEEGLLPRNRFLDRAMKRITLETGLAVAAVLILAGIGGTVFAFLRYTLGTEGVFPAERSMRVVIPSVTSLLLGVQTAFASFFLSVLGLRRH